MFNFLKRQQAPTILASCEKELKQTAATDVYFRADRDTTRRAELLQKAAAAGLGDHETVKRLEFLQRLIIALDGDPNATEQDALLAAATRYQLENTSGVRALKEHRELEILIERGPRVIAHDQQGRAVYLQCEAEFKNRPGQLEVREDGLTFSGEVVVEIAWSNVVHLAKTTHSYGGMDYSAVAVQEGKRRTPTKFVFRPRGAAYACEVTRQLWEQSKKRSPGGPT